MKKNDNTRIEYVTLKVKEHEAVFDDFNEVFFHKKAIKDEIGFLLNESVTDPYWFFKWDSQEKNKGSDRKFAYFASYIVGAKWVKENQALIISPKEAVYKLDFVKMFMTCLNGGMDLKEFSRIYQIDFGGKRIKTRLAQTVLEPLLLCHFLGLVEQITKRGLKKGYIYHNENLKKCKGRIDVIKNERKNLLVGRCDRVYCCYYEYDVNIPENKILKKALLISKNIISKLESSKKQSLIGLLRKCLSHFDKVDDDIQIRDIQNYKDNKLFKEYSEAIALAKDILNYSGYTIYESDKNTGFIPPFWINLSALFEYYLLSLMRDKYGDSIVYQDDYHNGFKFGWRPDYLLVDKGNPMIIDAKYIPDLKRNDRKLKDYVRQLGGYSIVEEIRRKIGIADGRCVPCILVYPSSPASHDKLEVNAESDFSNIELTESGLEDYKLKGIHKFYLLPIKLPMLH